MSPAQTLSASMEDYLEEIFHIIEKKQAARSKDISERMRVNRSSVTGALKALAAKGLVNYAPYDVVTLTPKGKALARRLARRHRVLRDFFVKVLGVSEAKAEEGACGMEHAVPKVILQRLARFVEFLELCPRGLDDWVDRFKAYCEHEGHGGICEMCSYSCTGAAEETN